MALTFGLPSVSAMLGGDTLSYGGAAIDPFNNGYGYSLGTAVNGGASTTVTPQNISNYTSSLAGYQTGTQDEVNSSFLDKASKAAVDLLSGAFNHAIDAQKTTGATPVSMTANTGGGGGFSISPIEIGIGLIGLVVALKVL